MKKTLYAIALMGLAFGTSLTAAAQGTRDKEVRQPVVRGGADELPERSCASMDVLAAQMAADPSLGQRMANIEAHTRSFVANAAGRRTTATTPITIPVVVHVVYNTAAQNVSDQAIANQIAVLNQDFGKTNADASLTPSLYAGVASAVNVRFSLQQVVRRQTRTTSFSSNDAVKITKRGGSDPVSPDKYLNLWVCNLGGGLLGYAQFPGGAPATDGVVVLFSSLPGGTAANYNLGRTATHEVGHWLNLRHIWGDATCGNDFVGDTPTQQTSNGGCPAFPKITCNNQGDMSMNYMDYTYDKCMYMFTAGQAARMEAVFATGGPRAAMAAASTTAGVTKTSVYPNPATDVLNIGVRTSERATVTVYDIHGQVMRGARFDATTGQVNVEGLNKGLYRVTIADGQQVTQQSFVKE
ncbi:M43 family zinc metalloprotease [Hymenobacter latericus]|uniref:M43 family zinc metalloprotease n=1 Tax=Hymenobacter sp. YIM 151858-1 TaxID=2987688 RepID=UPI00222789CD|nr:M43 family zinc metalloprotease [Hymenobacter sp. YIM 151858-1]UYZ57886.1 M43 family zinc metalloprotease [Hymenobacter sp. YIM 151858-1]